MKIIAFIDGSIYAHSVCDHTAWAASRTGASVEIFHVLGRRDVSAAPADYTGSLDADTRESLLAELTALDEQKAKLAQQKGRLILEQAKARLVAAGVKEVSTKLRHGDLPETVEEFEATAGLLVMGKRGEAADFAKGHLGSNLERVVRTTQKPVLIAARAFRPIQRILIAFDGGASIQKAVRELAASRMLQGYECVLVHAGASTADSSRRLSEAENTLRAAGYSVVSKSIPGEPEEVITRSVEQDRIDLLVMGAYGHSRIRNLIIGSTTTEMIRGCKIPVLVYR